MCFKNSARYYQANKDKIIAKSKLYQENTKYVRKSHTQQIEELNNKVKELTRALEMFFFFQKWNKIILKHKCRS